MRMLKLLGVFLIIAAGALAALTAVRLEKRKISVLDAWIDLIFYIRSQIDCYLMPLGEILAGTDRTLIRACLCTVPHPNLTALYHSSQFYLDNETRRLICAFIREIGGGYREEQLRRCDYYTATLRRIREKKAEELPARIRLCTAICLCVAAGAAILLW